MWKAFFITLLVEVCLFGVGLLTVPTWLSENVLIWLPAAFGLLLIITCWEAWPTWMHFSRNLFWSDLESGGRYYRDLLVAYGMDNGVKIFDAMSSPHPDETTSSPVGRAFRWIVQEAINSGEMEVWGIPENGSKPERLTAVEDDATAYRKSREGDSFFLMTNGVYYRGLQIKRSTIKSYVDSVRRRDARERTNC